MEVMCTLFWPVFLQCYKSYQLAAEDIWPNGFCVMAIYVTFKTDDMQQYRIQFQTKWHYNTRYLRG